MKDKLWMYLALSAVMLAVMDRPALADDLMGPNNTARFITTPNEISAFNSKFGAEMRLLQLSYSLEKNILWGEEIISQIKTLNSSSDTSELEAIVFSFKNLRDEVSAINSTNGESAAHEFVDAKAEAIDLTMQFRNESHSLIKSKDISIIKNNLTKLNDSKLRNISEQITKNLIEFNSERIQRLLDDLNVSDPDLIARIKAGNISRREVLEELRQDAKNLSIMTKPPRPGMRPPVPGMMEPFLPVKLKEGLQRDRIYMRSLEDSRMNEYLNKTKAKLTSRLEKAYAMNLSPQVLEMVKKRINQAENRTINMGERLEDRFAVRPDNFGGRMLGPENRGEGQ